MDLIGTVVNGSNVGVPAANVGFGGNGNPNAGVATDEWGNWSSSVPLVGEAGEGGYMQITVTALGDSDTDETSVDFWLDTPSIEITNITCEYDNALGYVVDGYGTCSARCETDTIVAGDPIGAYFSGSGAWGFHGVLQSMPVDLSFTCGDSFGQVATTGTHLVGTAFDIAESNFLAAYGSDDSGLDADEDGYVSAYDYYTFLASFDPPDEDAEDTHVAAMLNIYDVYGTVDGEDEEYNSAYDYNSNGVVDAEDLAYHAQNYAGCLDPSKLFDGESYTMFPDPKKVLQFVETAEVYDMNNATYVLVELNEEDEVVVVDRYDYFAGAESEMEYSDDSLTDGQFEDLDDLLNEDEDGDGSADSPPFTIFPPNLFQIPIEPVRPPGVGIDWIRYPGPGGRGNTWVKPSVPEPPPINPRFPMPGRPYVPTPGPPHAPPHPGWDWAPMPESPNGGDWVRPPNVPEPPIITPPGVVGPPNMPSPGPNYVWQNIPEAGPGWGRWVPKPPPPPQNRIPVPGAGILGWLRVGTAVSLVGMSGHDEHPCKNSINKAREMLRTIRSYMSNFGRMLGDLNRILARKDLSEPCRRIAKGLKLDIESDLNNINDFSRYLRNSTVMQNLDTSSCQAINNLLADTRTVYESIKDAWSARQYAYDNAPSGCNFD